MTDQTFLSVTRCADNGCNCGTDHPQPSGHPRGEWWSPISIRIICNDPTHERHNGPGDETRVTQAVREWCEEHQEHQYSLVVEHGTDGSDAIAEMTCSCGDFWSW